MVVAMYIQLQLFGVRAPIGALLKDFIRQCDEEAEAAIRNAPRVVSVNVQQGLKVRYIKAFEVTVGTGL
jgi:hypothetical protein